MSSHTTDWISSELPLSALYCLLYRRLKQFNEWNRRRIVLSLRNLHKRKQVACSVVVACLLDYPLFYTAICSCLFIYLSSFSKTALCCYLFSSLSHFLYWCCCYIFVYSLIMWTKPLFLILKHLFIILRTLFPFP